MHFSTLLTGLVMMSTTGWARYVLEDDYTKDNNFFDMFTFWNSANAADPTHGFVDYKPKSDAQSSGLIDNSGGTYNMRVDNSSVTPNGRPSVRLTSNKSYQSGLIILELAHMPASACGTWPAFWMVGPDWPNQGEIDIIEGVNQQQTNDMTLHTGPGCSISNTNKMTQGSTVASTSCVSGGSNNKGCQITTDQQNTYGDGFNNAGGGTYATEWTSSGISIYFWSADSAPSDVTNGSPDPSSWSAPIAYFSGGCDMSTAFTNQQIVFDTTFCGDWADGPGVWAASGCPKTCTQYVADTPEAFANSVWSVKGLKVYQNNGASSPSNPAPSAPASSSWASVGQTTFSVSTVPANSNSAWAPIVTSSGVVASAPVPTSTSAPVPTSTSAPAPSSPPLTSSQGWPGPSQTSAWGGPPQPSGWGETSNGKGGFDVSAPAAVKERHARHLRHHKKHGPGRL